MDSLRAKKLFGRAVRARRLALGISQEELAEKAGLHRTYIGDVERGQRNVSLINIIKFANALGVKPPVLLRESENS
jgi:transcriptional regulator with XRE-family HTH domain